MKVPEPMYATIGAAMPTGGEWVFEEKYDGMRIIAVVTGRSVQLVTRNGRDKRDQFPEIVDALRSLARHAKRPLIVDGEIVAIVRGEAAPFQALQGRFHRKEAIADVMRKNPAAIVLFDLLRDGRQDLTRLPLHTRRERLAELLKGFDDKRIRISDSSSNGKRMVAKARRRGWEGVIAKRVESKYVPGARSREWLKLKLQHRAEFVVGGYTEPRLSRPYLGALLLGYFDEAGKLCYVGRMGGGFDRASLKDMLDRLKPLERRTSPFDAPVKTNEPAHWVAPRVVVEIKFAEWTADGRLRQPIFLGMRDDKRARDVHKERESVQEWAQEIS
jgi:bifunctional non-homologous end joining protein LigD